MKTAAIYVRVSSSKKVASSPIGKIEDKYLQNPQVQQEPLIKQVKASGWELGQVYEDRMTGASTNRPAYKRLMEDARRRKFQVLVVWRFDRFARSIKELVTVLDEFKSLGIEFVSHQEAIDTSTPAGKVMFVIAAAFSEFERDIMRERIISGLEYAKEHGTKSGKPIGGQPKVFRRDEVVDLRREGLSYREISRRMKIGLGTVQRLCSTALEHETAVTDARQRTS